MNLKHLKTRRARQPFRHLTTLHFWRLISGVNPHILIVVEKPCDKNSESWLNFRVAIKTSISERNKPDERLAENIWLIPLNTGLPFLGQLASAALPKLPCKFLHFVDVPEWICLEQNTPALPAA
jgi:hypothetical protein